MSPEYRHELLKLVRLIKAYAKACGMTACSSLFFAMLNNKILAAGIAGPRTFRRRRILQILAIRLLGVFRHAALIRKRRVSVTRKTNAPRTQSLLSYAPHPLCMTTLQPAVL